MNQHRKSIFEEITRIDIERDAEYFIEGKVEHIVAGISNLLTLINETYDEDTARDLTKRLHNAIKTQDSAKFQRGIRKVSRIQKDR